MGLYNAASLAVQATSAINDVSSNAKGKASSMIQSKLGGGIAGKAATLASNNLIGRVTKKVNSFASKQLMALQNGGGGVSPISFDVKRSKNLYRSYRSVDRARKNHFVIRVSSSLRGDFSDEFDLLVTDLEFTPVNIAGEKKRTGSAYIDSVTGSEATELRFTTYDDQQGTIKQWFEDHAVFVCAPDGTYGVPSTYAIRFEIYRGFNGYMSQKDESVINTALSFVMSDTDSVGGFRNVGLFRTVSYDDSLSRREQALTEINLVFTQLDTFMGA